jgi:hypothetical protein
MLQAELSDAGYAGPWDIDSMLAAYDRAGESIQPGTTGASPSAAAPDADRQFLCSRYDPTAPDLAVTAAVVAVGLPTAGPYAEFLRYTYTPPAVYVQVATPGGIAPEAMRSGLIAYLRDAKPTQSPNVRVQYLVDAERQALTSGPHPFPGWWLAYCMQPDFDPAKAVRLFMLDAQMKPDILGVLCAAQGVGQFSATAVSLQATYLSNLARRQQVSQGPTNRGAFARLCVSIYPP